ncbi:protein disulfide-isomerase [Strigomonas culicis]|uniref:Protein disulfide-isomerase n=1 Tax=Strigomonas culicis TaxID=28005 RepID=S9W3U0_9TRYP|nr:protein disulfide-isomerase [Strigomonas culicis]|eukprot:EPY30525.1 protein disulfide-isomerase [Strigomonas culicis]
MSKMKKYLFLLALAALLVLSQVAAERKEASRVVHLTPDNFDNYVSTPQEKYVFVLYCVPWASTCKTVIKLWDRLSMSQSRKRHRDVFIAAYVDGYKYPGLVARMNVSGYPYMRYYTPFEPEGFQYSGLRELVLLESFVFQFT